MALKPLVAGMSQSPAAVPPAIGEVTGLASGVAAALSIEPEVKGGMALAGETLVANFVTTVASQFPGEMIFTDVPVTSGKTYIFEAEFWVVWQTAAASGDAELHDPAYFGTLTVDGSESFAKVRILTSVVFAGLGGGALGTITASTTPQLCELRGRFKATNSDNFNIELMVGAWDSGDVVTVLKGARLKVRQID